MSQLPSYQRLASDSSSRPTEKGGPTHLTTKCGCPAPVGRLFLHPDGSAIGLPSSARSYLSIKTLN